MWVKELKLDNIKCFDNVTIRFARGDKPYPWITFLGENGGGKSTLLQCLGLLLAGPESIQNLMPRPNAWLRAEDRAGVISTHIHQGNNDPGQHGEAKIRKEFGYSYHVTGSQPITVRNRLYSEPTVLESKDSSSNLSWLRQNAFAAKGKGWFAAGYGAFRRLTRSSQIIIPSLDAPSRFSNFQTLFSEDEPLTAFERWMVYLDYRISKANDSTSRLQQMMGIHVINDLLPEGARFDKVTEEGRICFNVKGTIVSTIGLSDGFRSILALAGDLVWRLINAFPSSADPLKEEGIVLIDELDIHLHPQWQRTVAGLLRRQFPNVQFIVATHSPLIAAGAGEDALTLKLSVESGRTYCKEIQNIAAYKVDHVLASDAFQLVSPYSPETQSKIDRFDLLAKKSKKTPPETHEYQKLLEFVDEARPFEGPPAPGSLEERIDRFLEEALT